MKISERFRFSRFVSGEKSPDQVVLNHRRIFILPSRRGLGFAVLIMLLMSIAYVYNNNLAYMLAFLLASVFVVAILHTYKALAGLVVHKGRSLAVFAGEAAGFVVHIDNVSGTERSQLQVALRDSQALTIPPHSSAHVTLYSLTGKRGRHPAGTVTLSSTFPLGLFRAWSPIRFDWNALVYPKPATVEIPFPQTATADGQLGYSANGGEEFHGLQQYQAGDSIKHIHWKAYAKGLGVFSKQYGGESATDEVWLDYELAPGHDTEQRLSQLCRWLVDAEQAGIRYGFVLPGLKLPPGQGPAHYQKCLEALALF